MRRVHTALVLAGLTVACSGQVCTLIGCMSGLTLEFPVAPSAPFRVEVQSSPNIGTRSYECAVGSRCHVEQNFDGFFPETATITVTYEGRSQTTVVRPTYTESFPNGTDCGPACQSAILSVPLP